MEKTLIIPSKPEEINLYQYRQYAIEQRNGSLTYEGMIAILTGCTVEEAKKIRAVDVARTVQALQGALVEMNHPHQSTFSFRGVEYGFIPNLDEISFGEMVDIATYIDQPETWHKAMAILYRRVTKKTSKMGGLYQIEPHDHRRPEYLGRQQVMDAAPSTLFLGARDFFLNGSQKLSVFTTRFLTRHESK
jgi:hypothetical protein